MGVALLYSVKQSMSTLVLPWFLTFCGGKGLAFDLKPEALCVDMCHLPTAQPCDCPCASFVEVELGHRLVSLS